MRIPSFPFCWLHYWAWSGLFSEINCFEIGIRPVKATGSCWAELTAAIEAKNDQCYGKQLSRRHSNSSEHEATTSGWGEAALRSGDFIFRLCITKDNTLYWVNFAMLLSDLQILLLSSSVSPPATESYQCSLWKGAELCSQLLPWRKEGKNLTHSYPTA